MTHISQIFDLGTELLLDQTSQFAQRLRTFSSERGL